MKTSIRQNRCAFRFFAGGCALLLYVGTSSPLGLSLAALLGSLDRDHHVAVQTGTDGTRVALHHEQRPTAHHHGVVARALTLFAAPSSPGEADHVLQFSAADSFSRQSQQLAPSPGVFALPEFALLPTGLLSVREGFVFSIPTHPPPVGCGQLLCARSTVLLI